MRDTQGSGVFAISSACCRRRRIADSWWTQRVAHILCTRNSRHGYEAYEQLAMFHERKALDPEQARQIVRQVLDELRRAIQVGDITPGPYREIKARFDQRMTRLERKSRRPLLDLLAMESRAQW